MGSELTMAARQTIPKHDAVNRINMADITK
jgi:hypothetical protein